MTIEPDYTKFHTFNGLVETSMRLLMLLERFHDIPLNFEELRLVDFFAVFIKDVGGKTSLHVQISNRAGAYAIRGEHYFPAALTFLQRAGLIEQVKDRYSATHEAETTPFVSPYLTALDRAAAWLRDQFEQKGRVAFFSALKARVFQLMEENLASGLVRDDAHFTLLRQMYPNDLNRLAGLVESCSLFIAYLENDRKVAANDDGSRLPPFAYFVEVAEQAKSEAAKIDSNWAGLKELVASIDLGTQTG
jgi:hypothetical protein